MIARIVMPVSHHPSLRSSDETTEMLLIRRTWRNYTFAADQRLSPGQVLFGQVEPTALRANTSGSEIAPIVVTSHTTTVVAAQDAMPLMVSP